MKLFPELTVPKEGSLTEEFPVYREWAYDFKRNEFLLRKGEYYLVEKNEALRIWCYKALKTKRYVFQAYSRAFGSELENALGVSMNREIVESEIERYITECLMVNPYISEVEELEFSYETGVHVRCTVTTIYDRIELEIPVEAQ